jgi:hypothetical protein
MRVHYRADEGVLQHVEEETRAALRLSFERWILDCKVLKLVLEILMKQINRMQRGTWTRQYNARSGGSERAMLVVQCLCRG